MVEISYSNIIDGIWLNFYELIRANVTSIVDSEFGTVTIQNYSSDYDDRWFKSETSFPTIVIENPTIPIEQFTMKKSRVIGTINIDINAKQNKMATKFGSLIYKTIDDSRGDLAALNIKRIELDDTDTDSATFNGFKIHKYTLKFKFECVVQRGVSF